MFNGIHTKPSGLIWRFGRVFVLLHNINVGHVSMVVSISPILYFPGVVSLLYVSNLANVTSPFVSITYFLYAIYSCELSIGAIFVGYCNCVWVRLRIK